MIRHLRIRNWQSLRDVQLELGRFTVIVGASNTGKSALVRALRALACNVRGAAAITRGQGEAQIGVETDTGAQVTFSRTASTATYRLRHPEGHEQLYTKLAGAVPADISAALGLAPDATGSVNFAAQFDRPYLLDASGGEVARDLGSLCDADTLLGAAGEANRRRVRAQQSLKTRQEDLAGVVAATQRFQAVLPGHLARCDEAEQALRRAQQLTDAINRLTAARDAVAIAQGVLERHVALPQVPQDTTLRALRERLGALSGLLGQINRAQHTITSAQAVVTHWQAQEGLLAGQLHDTLLAAGTCPLCGQTVTT